MEDLGPFLLPVIGGFYFSKRWLGSQYRVAREDGHKLFFRSGWVGVQLFLVADTARVIGSEILLPWMGGMNFCVMLSNLSSASFFPNEHEAWVLGFASCILGYFSPWVLNRYTDRQKHLNRAIKHDDFALLCQLSLDMALPLCLTMDDKKVYVGYYVRGYAPREWEHMFTILPMASGFRDEKGEVFFTTDYEGIYEKIQKDDGSINLPEEAFVKVLPFPRVASANLFDFNAYKVFQENTLSAMPMAKA